MKIMEKKYKQWLYQYSNRHNKDFNGMENFILTWNHIREIIEEEKEFARNKTLTFDEILTIISEVKSINPYPSDIFKETPQMDKQKINKFCRDNGISIDGYNGSWGNKVWNNCCDNLIRIIKETKDDRGLKITQPLGEVASVVVK